MYKSVLRSVDNHPANSAGKLLSETVEVDPKHETELNSAAFEAHSLHQEVMGSNPTGCWAFFFFEYFPTLFHHWSVLNEVFHRSASVTAYESN